MKFPFIGSAVLVSLFVAFRFLPKHWVNAALTLYFVVLGTAALAATILPFVEAAFPAAARKHKYVLARGVTVPYLVKVRMEKKGLCGVWREKIKSNSQPPFFTIRTPPTSPSPPPKPPPAPPPPLPPPPTA